MKVLISFLAVSLIVGAGAPAAAGTPTDTFSTCLVDMLNGKERKALAKWIFFSIAAHPEIHSFASITAADAEASDQYIGALVTRLLTMDCPNEFQAASEADPMAVEKAFQVVGEVAMQELMADDAVMKAISNYIKYADTDKINEVLVRD